MHEYDLTSDSVAYVLVQLCGADWLYKLLDTFLLFMSLRVHLLLFFFFFQAEDGIRDLTVTGVQTCALPIWCASPGCPPGTRLAIRRAWPPARARRRAGRSSARRSARRTARPAP